MFGTNLHLITLLYLTLEIIILSVQVAACLSRPKDIRRFRFFILISLFILFNVFNGFFPNPSYVIPILIQDIIAYSSGIALATFYFYFLVNELKIKSGKYYNTKFLFSSLVVSFIIGLVFTYLFTGEVNFSEEIFIVPPIFIAVYFCIRTLIFIFKSQEDVSSHYKSLTILGYIGAVFMSSMPIVVYFGDIQPVKISLINISFLLTAFAFYKNQLYLSRKEYKALNNIGFYAEKAITIEAPIIKDTHNEVQLTAKETEVCKLILEELTYQEIGEKMHITKNTVSKHASNIFKKTNCANKKDYIEQYGNEIPQDLIKNT